MTRRGPGPAAWIIAGIVVWMLLAMAATIAVSARFDVAGGYIPPEVR